MTKKEIAADFFEEVRDQMIVIVSVTLMAIALNGFGISPASADDCPKKTTSCNTVTDQSYGGGGHNPDNLVRIKACLDNKMYDSIQLRDGTSAWEVGFYYQNDEPEVVRTVRNYQCWTHSDKGKPQYGAVGAWVVAYIDCTYYRGWVGGKIPANGEVDLVKIKLPRSHDPMR